MFGIFYPQLPLYSYQNGVLIKPRYGANIVIHKHRFNLRQFILNVSFMIKLNMQKNRFIELLATMGTSEI